MIVVTEQPDLRGTIAAQFLQKTHSGLMPNLSNAFSTATVSESNAFFESMNRSLKFPVFLTVASFSVSSRQLKFAAKLSALVSYSYVQKIPELIQDYSSERFMDLGQHVSGL